MLSGSTLRHARTRPAWLLLATLALGLSGACTGRDDPRPGGEPTADALSEDRRPGLARGVISRYNPIVMYRRYQPLVDRLSHGSRYRFVLKLSPSYEEAVRMLGEGEVDVASLGGFTYLIAHRLYGARPLLRPRNKDGDPFYRSVLVVRRDSPIRSLPDLRGRSLALGPPHSTSGSLIPLAELVAAGLELDDLGRLEHLPHHDDVARQVLEGRFDAGAMKDIIAAQYEPRGLRAIHVSPPIPGVPITVLPGTPDSVQAAIVEAFTNLSRKAGEAPIWDEEFRHGFVATTDADYEPLRRKLAALGGCDTRCHTRPR